MGDRDAFGRELGEDTLAGLRGEEAAPPPASVPHPAPAASPTPTPTPTASSATTPPAAPRQPPTSPWTGRPNVVVRRPSGFRLIRIVSAVVGVVILLAVIGSVTHDVKSVTDKIHIPKINFPKTPKIPAGPGGGGGGGKPAKAPVGLGRGSLMRAAGLRHTLAIVARAHGGKVQLLRVAPERVDVTMIDGKGRLHQIQVPAGAKRPTVLSVSGGGIPASNAKPLRAFDPAAPERLVRAAARRAHVPAKAIDYVAIAPSSIAPLMWTAHFKRGGTWLGDAHGRVDRRI